MPRITTDSGKTLDDVLQADLFDRAPVTRSGDSIVPPSVIEVTKILGVEPKKEGDYYVYQDVDFSKCDRSIIPNFAFEIDLPASHSDDPHTSKQAAESVINVAHWHRIAILTALQLFGPATGHELAARLGLEYVQVAKRLTELHDDQRIIRRETGAMNGNSIYQTRPSPSGRQACVWHLNPLAK